MTAFPLSLQTYGPPESPWQASLPPTPVNPAQSIESVILPPYAALHALLVTAGTLTYWRLSVADPPKKQSTFYSFIYDKHYFTSI